MKVKYRYIIMCLTALLIVSCQNDTDAPSDVDAEEVRILVGASTQSFVDIERMTRALPDGYQNYEESGSTTHGTIKLFFTQKDGETQTSTTAFCTWKESDIWEGKATIKPGTYYIYGYMPQEAATSSISSDDYSQGATITLDNLSTASDKDVCVVVGVARENGALDIKNSTTSVATGSYSFASTNGDNRLYLLMNHIYTELALSFSVHSDYAKLRKIKVKEVVLTTKRGTTQAVMRTGQNNATVTFDATTETDHIVKLLENEDGEPIAVNPAKTIIPAFFAPLKEGAPRRIHLTTYYDVYDRYDNMVRENCQAVNEWTVNETLNAGDIKTINLLIEPTYLYQLGDPDLDNPTIKIGN